MRQLFAGEGANFRPEAQTASLAVFEGRAPSFF
jgi:hypothetical protein